MFRRGDERAREAKQSRNTESCISSLVEATTPCVEIRSLVEIKRTRASVSSLSHKIRKALEDLNTSLQPYSGASEVYRRPFGVRAIELKIQVHAYLCYLYIHKQNMELKAAISYAPSCMRPYRRRFPMPVAASTVSWWYHLPKLCHEGLVIAGDLPPSFGLLMDTYGEYDSTKRTQIASQTCKRTCHPNSFRHCLFRS